MISNDSSARILDDIEEEALFLEHFRDPQVRANLEQGWAEYQAGLGLSTEEAFAGLEEEIWQWAKDIS